MSFKIGEVIAGYQVVGLLGAGGMGSVYKVRNLISDRLEALKVLLPDLHDSSDLADRFMREIKVHASLTHPGIAGLHTAIRVGNQLLMVIELVEGGTLQERMRKSGPLSVEETRDCMRQVLAALGYAHQRGVVHRDIKPANIMLLPDGTVKLLDFGIASTHRDRRLTNTGMAIGSLNYMSPEQVRAMPADARSDIYSVGVTMYEMLTGELPCRGESDYDVMTAHMDRIPAAPSSRNPAIPVALSAAVMRALAKNPADRFQAAEEFETALRSTGTMIAPSAATWDPGVLEQIRKELARYIGPLAKILVSRAAKQTSDKRRLYELLAEEIPSPEDRAKFLSSR